MKNFVRTIAGAFVFMGLFTAGSVSALSVQWTTAPKNTSNSDISSFILSDRSYGQGAWGTYIDGWNYGRVLNPNITITYGARVTNAETGTVIACGSSVPIGTRLKLAFDTHDYSDIYWFASGGSFDSPYGEWVNAAGKPDSDMCTYLPAKDYVDTYDTRNVPAGSPADIAGKIYSTLSVDPPTKTLPITGGVNCSGGNTSLSRTCTANAAGTVSVKFQFSATIGKFYGRTKVTRGSNVIPNNSCYTSNRSMQHVIKHTSDGEDFVFEGYTLQVPAKTISCSINVTSSESARTLSGAGGSGGDGLCVVGKTYTIRLDSTPAANSQIRYLVDWNADDNVDQIVPSSGYVDAGTNQTASRTFATSGSKAVKVRIEDSSGNLSAPSIINFICSNAQEANLDVQDADGDGFADGSFGDNNNGIGSTGAAQAPVLSLRAVPSLIARGDKSAVYWSANNVEPNSCVVTGSNGDTWTSDEDGKTTAPIQDRTDYVLSCTGEDGSHPTKTVTISILPTEEER